MTLRDGPDRYGLVSLILHWGLAGSMLASWLLGQLDEEGGGFALHVSLGLLALAFAGGWLVWRLRMPRPQPVVSSPLERTLARTVQAGLVATALIGALSGILAQRAEGDAVRFFGVPVAVPEMPSPVPAARADGDGERWGDLWDEEESAGETAGSGSGEFWEELHELVVQPLFLLLLALHLAGVVKHHLWDGVPILRRMLGCPLLPAGPPGH